MRRKRTMELPLTDFEGRTFGSYAEMAAFYGIDANLLHARWRYGKMTLKECLTKPVNKSRAHRRPVTDCCGQEFDNATAMCRKWRVGRTTFNYRISSGWKLEKALSAPAISGHPRQIQDHTGRWFKSHKELCEFWGVNYGTFNSRYNRGLKMKDCVSHDNLSKRRKNGR